MTGPLFYLAIFFGLLFVAKMLWLAYSVWARQIRLHDDDGPVSGWGTPQG